MTTNRAALSIYLIGKTLLIKYSEEIDQIFEGQKDQAEEMMNIFVN